MLEAGWPYRAANWLTDRKPARGMPPSTWASSEPMFCSLRMNDTITGVSDGVFPKTVAPGSEAAPIPAGTAVGGFGPGLEAADAPEGPARGTSSAPTPSNIPAVSRALLRWIMSCAPSYTVAVPAHGLVAARP